MRKIKLTDNIYQYEFLQSENNPVHVVNITVLVDGNRALIIDTANANHAKEVKMDLDREGIKPEIVVLSHYHPDHVNGTVEFKGCSFIGSKYYKNNLEKCLLFQPKNEIIEPNILVDKHFDLQFGRHNVSIVHTPGHSKCSITTIIDDEVVHVGDLIMKTKYGKTILPYVCEDGSFNEHIESIQKVLDITHNIMAFSHGDYASGQANIKRHAEDRLYYLKRVKDSKGKLNIEECLSNHITHYEDLNTHQKNINALEVNFK